MCKDTFSVQVNFVWEPRNSLLELCDSSERLHAYNLPLHMVIYASTLILCLFVKKLAISSCKSRISSKRRWLHWSQVSSSSFVLQIPKDHCHTYWELRRFLFFSEFFQNYFPFFSCVRTLIEFPPPSCQNFFYWLLPSTADPLSAPCLGS